MAKSLEELEQIKLSLIKAYADEFAEPMPQDLIDRLLGDYLQQQRVKFILNRINGLNAANTKTLIDMFKPVIKPVEEKVPNVGHSKPAKAKAK